MADRTAAGINSIPANGLGPFCPMTLLVADDESGLASEEVAQWLDRAVIELKMNSPGTLAQMVERPRAAQRDHPQV